MSYTKSINDKKLIKNYKEHRSLKLAANKFGISQSTARSRLIKMGVSTKQFKYSCDEDFFSRDTPESFYWAGFIAADGCIKKRKHSKKANTLSIALAHRDMQLLRLFKSTIKFNGGITKEKESVRITITSLKVAEDLERFNIVQRKSLIYSFPEWLINHSLVNHFMRGYFDGDGCFTVAKQKGKRNKKLCIGIRGTVDFLEIFNKVILLNCDIGDNRKVHKYDSIGSLYYVGNKICSKVRDFLYMNSNSKIRLRRKYNISHRKEFMNIPENCNHKSIIGIHKNSGEIIKFNAVMFVKTIGLRPNCVSRCLCGHRKTYAGFKWKYS